MRQAFGRIRRRSSRGAFTHRRAAYAPSRRPVASLSPIFSYRMLPEHAFAERGEASVAYHFEPPTATCSGRTAGVRRGPMRHAILPKFAISRLGRYQ